MWVKCSWKDRPGPGHEEETWLYHDKSPPSSLIFQSFPPSTPCFWSVLLNSLFSRAARMILQKHTNLITSPHLLSHKGPTHVFTKWTPNLSGTHYSAAQPGTTGKRWPWPQPWVWLIQGTPLLLCSSEVVKNRKSAGGNAWKAAVLLLGRALQNDQTHGRSAANCEQGNQGKAVAVAGAVEHREGETLGPHWHHWMLH